jgi:hypothetical protein
VNSRGHCRRQIIDAHRRVKEIEEFLGSKSNSKLRRIFGKDYRESDVILDAIKEEFGEKMLLEPIWF